MAMFYNEVFTCVGETDIQSALGNAAKADVRNFIPINKTIPANTETEIYKFTSMLNGAMDFSISLSSGSTDNVTYYIYYSDGRKITKQGDVEYLQTFPGQIRITAKSTESITISQILERWSVFPKTTNGFFRKRG